MEKISDFFKEVKERLSSPLFSSFLMSWLIINWPIAISLLFYKNGELYKDGYKSYIDLIEKNSTTYKILYLPLLISLAYTFAFPFFRNVILVFTAWVKAWGSEWNLKASKTAKVSILKYIELKNTYESRTKLLEETLEKESKFLNENEVLRNEVANLKSTNIDTLKKLDQWQNSNTSKILEGKWQKTLQGTLAEESEKPTMIRIRDGQIFNNWDISARQSKASQLIQNFHYNPITGEISLIVTPITNDGSGKYELWILEAFGDGIIDELKGDVDRRQKLILKKIDG